MTIYRYSLGSAKWLEQLYPSPNDADPSLGFKDFSDVISHYTNNSLKADGIAHVEKVEVSAVDGEYLIEIEGNVDVNLLESFGNRHAQIFNKNYAVKAIRGKELLQEMGVWNPMEGYHVNKNPMDGTSKWTLFPPLGLNIIGQKGLLLLHYPPWAVLQEGTFDNAMTFQRWGRILEAVGIASNETSKFKTFIDINPIAAPGSGESEYENDYFPIMMATGFFDGPSDRDYIKSMLELYLSPPDLPEDSKYTLPILICGSPGYDPQAPGWFRTAYTNILPMDDWKIPQVNVMQAGKFRLRLDSKKETPYLIGNHMIAASVTGRCTTDASKIPDIRQYEAQDLVAAEFLKIYTENPSMEPEEVKAQACERWYGNSTGTGVPKPADKNDTLILCALAQMDLFFSPIPKPHPTYTFEEAMKRCKTASDSGNPCCNGIKPTDRSED
jgi:hypothetical protein